jgi:hypothetical protein
MLAADVARGMPLVAAVVVAFAGAGSRMIACLLEQSVSSSTGQTKRRLVGPS